ANPQVSACESGTGIKPKPAKGQNERTQNGQRQVVARNSARLAIGSIFADACSDNDGAGEPDETSHRMDDTGAGEVNGPMTEVPVLSHLGEPAAAPNPVGINAIRQGDPEPVKTEVLPRPALGHGTRWNRGRRIKKYHLEEEERENAHVFYSI